MARRKILFYTFIFIIVVNLLFAEDAEFNFYSEDIDASQLKTIEVILPDTSSKSTGKIWEYRYIIKIGNDGIVRSVVLDNDNSYAYIYRKGNLLNISSSKEKPRISNIRWDNGNIYVRGLQETYYSKTNDFTQIKIQPSNDIIYETPIIKLQKFSNGSLKQTNQKGGLAFQYSNNVTEGFFSNDPDGNPDSKIEYKFIPEKSEKIMAIYYGGIDGDDRYAPPIRIIKNNTKLYSDNQLLNILNYFIINSVSIETAEALFPLLFLENPFTRNNWSYTASSFLKEKNAEYGANNLSSIGGLPWASANGYGIGDKITVNMGSSPNNCIFVINGYVSNDRPDLFTVNSRAKEIKLTNLNNGRSKKMTVEDSNNLQVFGISDLSPIFRLDKNTRLEIEILSVYPGTKYKDLCIQSIF
jgi:hypothetical protein